MNKKYLKLVSNSGVTDEKVILTGKNVIKTNKPKRLKHNQPVKLFYLKGDKPSIYNLYTVIAYYGKIAEVRNIYFKDKEKYERRTLSQLSMEEASKLQNYCRIISGAPFCDEKQTKYIKMWLDSHINDWYR